MDADGLNTDLAPSLVARARTWATYRGTLADGRLFDQWGPVVRCRACDARILPHDLAGRVGHLTGSHGYRMDGRRFNDKNEEVGYAHG